MAAAINFVREQNLTLSIRGGAHHQAGEAIVDNGVVIDLAAFDHIDIDAEEQIANIGPGTQTKEVIEATQAHGLATPTGSAGCVGMGGTTLGGGIGWLRRKHGLSIDSLRSMEVVTADGAVHTASENQNADLFWALRGGGGQFGIVTNFEFELYDVGPLIGGLITFYPADAARTVLETYSEFTEPEAMSSIVNYGEVPAVPPIPESQQGEPAIGIIGCYAGNPETAMDAFAPLREITEPLIDATEPMAYTALHEIGTLMHPWGRKYINRSVFVDELTEQILELVITQTDTAPGEMDGVGIWSMVGLSTMTPRLHTRGEISHILFSSKLHGRTMTILLILSGLMRLNSDSVRQVLKVHTQDTLALKRVSGNNGKERSSMIITTDCAHSRLAMILLEYLIMDFLSLQRQSNKYAG